jgi:hypothetical protein
MLIGTTNVRLSPEKPEAWQADSVDAVQAVTVTV